MENKRIIFDKRKISYKHTYVQTASFFYLRLQLLQTQIEIINVLIPVLTTCGLRNRVLRKGDFIALILGLD